MSFLPFAPLVDSPTCESLSELFSLWPSSDVRMRKRIPHWVLRVSLIGDEVQRDEDVRQLSEETILSLLTKEEREAQGNSRDKKEEEVPLSTPKDRIPKVSSYSRAINQRDTNHLRERTSGERYSTEN